MKSITIYVCARLVSVVSNCLFCIFCCLLASWRATCCDGMHGVAKLCHIVFVINHIFPLNNASNAKQFDALNKSLRVLLRFPKREALESRLTNRRIQLAKILNQSKDSISTFQCMHICGSPKHCHVFVAASNVTIISLQPIRNPSRRLRCVAAKQ